MKLKILTFVAATFTLLACDSYFERAKLPATQITDNWSGNEELEKLTVASYFLWQGYHEGVCDLSVMIPSFTSDEGKLSTENDQHIEFGNHDKLYNRETDDAAIPYLARIWQSGYEVVRSANTVINHLNENGAFDDSFIDWEDRMKGENYFCRAYAFHTLVKNFAHPFDASSDMSVPAIICDTINTEGAFDTKGLKSIQYVYNQIISDLENAIYYLPESYNADRDPLSYQDRAKKDAARFLLARVYFQMGPEFWEKSLNQIDSVLKDNKYPLQPNPAEAFISHGLGEFASETVFKYAAYNDQSRWRIPSMYYYFGGGSGTGRKRMFHMNDQFAKFIGWYNSENIEFTEFTNSLSKDLRYQQLFVNYSSSGIWADKWKTIGDDLPMMRSAELHLTRAAICLLTGMGGGNSQAINDLNIIMARAYGSNHVPLDNSYSTDELLDIMHKERAIELFFEGDRLYYIQALRGEVGPGERSNQELLPWNSDKLYWPIPERENNLNDKI